MIRFRLDELLKARNWSDYKLAKESKLGAAVIGKYRRNLVRQPDLRVMNTMCETLRCGIGDLLEYVPDSPQPRRKKRASKASQ